MLSGCAQPPVPIIPRAVHNILIAGGLDPLRIEVANEVRRHLATDVRRTTIRLIPAGEIDMAAMPEHREADMPLALADLRELGKLLRADMIVGLAIEHRDNDLEVELCVVSPIRAAPRTLLRTRARSASELGLGLAQAIRADSAYRRLLGSEQ